LGSSLGRPGAHRDLLRAHAYFECDGAQSRHALSRSGQKAGLSSLSASGSFAAARAFVLFGQTIGTQEERLGRILTFFGVPWQSVSVADVVESGLPAENGGAYTFFGSADVLAAALALPRGAAVIGAATALYAYASADREASRRAVSALTGTAWTWASPPTGSVPVEITNCCRDLTGPMSGLRLSIQLAPEGEVLVPSEVAVDRASDDGRSSEKNFTSIVSVNRLPAFVRVLHHGVPAYICASPTIVDIDAPVGHNYYDVKAHFLSAVPLVMFITCAFGEVMWRPNELGACLIIDDPLLKRRYGFCDFERLRDLMRQHQFTTNIAFIPWNWRRTSSRASAFFRRESDLFSVSIHGCDHVSGEFGATSLDVIQGRARLAQTRMRKHEARTQIPYDPVMVFPQGIFSSACPDVLKRNGFVAAVNTEISPVDADGPKTLVRDVWDVAIVRYGSFAIYTRRYQQHGVENFAFDLLLGKPCFIVAHHEFFRDGGSALVTLIDNLRALNTLRWCSSCDVVRRAYRSRKDGELIRVQMYGSEVLLRNRNDRVSEFAVDKRETEPSIIADVAQDGREIRWSHTPGGLHFRCVVPPRGEALVKVRYHGTFVDRKRRPSLKYGLSVAARRILSEFRDEYVQRLYPRQAEPTVVLNNRRAAASATGAASV
jgi:hypothetical protein